MVRRVAVMVAAGLGVERVWDHLSETGDYSAATRALLRACHRAGRDGRDVPGAVRDQVGPGSGGHDPASASWLGLAATLAVAERAGAPLAHCLHRLAESYEANAQGRRAMTVSLSGSRATARLMMWLPAVSIGLSSVLGFNTIAVLVGTLPGLVCAALGATLTVLGALWSNRMITRASRGTATPGICLDLTALAVSGGGSLRDARRLVADTVERFGLEEGAEPVIAQRSLALADRAGVPAADLLSADADLVRAEHTAEAGRRAASLGVALMVPLAVCTLPAFMLLGVVPMMLSILSTVWVW
ncbi:hypothetical protein GCM10022198_25340 [Klugiella xanthotipulae]|uniref:Tight adherence protein B n=1 Tax=Klugiella xanthotipulae TaxID=244735 RepID=A0A543HZ86_9MICO|nr:tight adherence protein B [Klugiella xanthotipulae]